MCVVFESNPSYCAAALLHRQPLTFDLCNCMIATRLCMAFFFFFGGGGGGGAREGGGVLINFMMNHGKRAQKM